MSKYITEYQTTGNCKIDIDRVCKKWNNRFVISTYEKPNEVEYTLVINGKCKNTTILMTLISKEQASLVINKLNLIHVKSLIFARAGTYHSKSFINSEIKKLSKIKLEQEMDLSITKSRLSQYEKSIR